MAKKKLFSPPPPGQESHIASVGGYVWSTTYVYTKGYKDAADILVEQAKGSTGDFLFWPMYFNYRHFVELSLKYLIRRAEEVWDLCVRYHVARGQLSERATQKLEHTHNIRRLLEWLIERLSLLTQRGFDPDIRQILIELHNFDRDSQVSRYPYRKKKKVKHKKAPLWRKVVDILQHIVACFGKDRNQNQTPLLTPSKEAQKIIDLLNVKQKMQDVADYLDEIDGMLDSMAEALAEGVIW